MKEVHFIAQGKGGVGKSTIASFLGDYLKAKASGEQLHCFDTDPVNPSFSRFSALNPEVIDILNDSNNIDSRYFDGLIITGAPVEHLPFEAVDYWEEFQQVIEWSKTHVFSTLHICW